MTADQRFFGLCALVYGALFLACVFVGGIVVGNVLAWRSALIALLASFLCFLCQASGLRGVACAPLVVSWWFGGAAFGFLLFNAH